MRRRCRRTMAPTLHLAEELGQSEISSVSIYYAYESLIGDKVMSAVHALSC